MTIGEIKNAPSSLSCPICGATGPFEEIIIFYLRDVEFRVASGEKCPRCTESRGIARFRNHSYCKRTKKKIYLIHSGAVWVDWENYVQLLKCGTKEDLRNVNRALLNAQVLTRSLDGSFGVYMNERVATPVNEDGNHYFFVRHADAKEYARALDPEVETPDCLDIRKMRPLRPDVP